MKLVLVMILSLVSVNAQAMNFGQLKAMVAAIDAGPTPDSAVFAVKTVNAEIMQINANSFSVVGEDSDVTLDAGNNWAGVPSQVSAVYLKQD